MIVADIVYWNLYLQLFEIPGSLNPSSPVGYQIVKCVDITLPNFDKIIFPRIAVINLKSKDYFYTHGTFQVIRALSDHNS